MRNFLTQLVADITRWPRYQPQIKWSSSSWISNIFRAYEYLFGRGWGVRPEANTSVRLVNGEWQVRYKFHTLESFLAHIEGTIRLYFALFPAFFRFPQSPLNYRPVYVTFSILGLVLSFHTHQHMLPFFGILLAIAHDNAAGNSVTSVGPMTYNHTVAGSDTIIYGGMMNTADVVSAVTFDSAALSLARKTAGQFSHENYIYGKINPSAGTKVFSITWDGVNRGCFAESASYSGVDQTSFPDNSGDATSGSGSSLAASVTPNATGCWAAGFFIHGAAHPITSVTNGTIRGVEQGSEASWYDSNGTVTAGVAYTFTMNLTGSDSELTITLVSIAPKVATNFPKPVKILQAVNRSNTY